MTKENDLAQSHGNAGWHSKKGEEVVAAFRSSPYGLASREAAERLARSGPNKIPEQKTKGWAAIFFKQFRSPLIYVLVVADAIVFSIGEYRDGVIILFVLFFNAILGAIQEGKAENILAALARFTETRAAVLRDGKEMNIPASEIVPGDIILLYEGEKVPADARLLSARNLKIDEAILTGESHPTHKSVDPLPPGRHLHGELINMVFKGTNIAFGTGNAVVVATGKDTAIGAISERVREIDTEIPLTKNLRELARTVAVIVVSVTALVFLLGAAQGHPLADLFTAAVAIAVAAVPEGLPLVLTITLAMGVWRLGKKRVLVRQLQAVEALGHAQDIAVDKTGTITKNELVVRKVIAGGKEFTIDGVGYDPAPRHENPPHELRLAGLVATFCSDAHFVPQEDGETTRRLIGDPTEGALAVFAEKVGMDKTTVGERYTPVNDWPFDYEKKFHLALYRKGQSYFLAITGAPEIILGLSKRQLTGGAASTPLSDETRGALERRMTELSGGGLRVIGFAFQPAAPETADPDHLPPLIFGGFYAMQDALRHGIQQEVARAQASGIRVIMITGDHAVTAKAIAAEAGIYREGDGVLTGDDIDTLTPEEFSRRLRNASVCARVTPEHKLKIIQDYRQRGDIIAMTGDGVNDAPSLAAADLGIAMGKTGTEVAKSASDLVLMEDNFGDIITAIEEGRNMRAGMRRAITYLFSSNIGEILLIVTALSLGYPLPLLATQLIWMNVVTDTFFDISLALEPKDGSLMKRTAGKPKKLFDRLIAGHPLRADHRPHKPHCLAMVQLIELPVGNEIGISNEPILQ